MYPILFQFGPITIYSFGAFMALAEQHIRALQDLADAGRG